MNTATTVFRSIACVAVIAGALETTAAAFAAGAEWRPDRPIRFVVGGSPGGAFGAVALLLAPKYQEALGQPWVVDHRGGAGGSVAGQIVASANPDGYTLLMSNGIMLTVRPQLYKAVSYKVSDLLPVSTLTRGQYMLVVHPSVGASTVKELVAIAKSKPAGSLSYASTGVGAPTHLGAEMLGARAGIRMTQIPYKGGSAAALGVVRGDAHLTFVALISAIPQAKAGRVKALGVSGLERSALAPEVPTVAEQGFPGFDMTTWYGLFLPAKTPAHIVRAMQDITEKALKTPDVADGIARFGLEVFFRKTQEVEQLIRNESKTWAKVIKDAKIEVQ